MTQTPFLPSLQEKAVSSAPELMLEVIYLPQFLQNKSDHAKPGDGLDSNPVYANDTEKKLAYLTRFGIGKQSPPILLRV
jgi:hypothetical protein